MYKLDFEFRSCSGDSACLKCAHFLRHLHMFCVLASKACVIWMWNVQNFNRPVHMIPFASWWCYKLNILQNDGTESENISLYSVNQFLIWFYCYMLFYVIKCMWFMFAFLFFIFYFLTFNNVAYLFLVLNVIFAFFLSCWCFILHLEVIVNRSRIGVNTAE